ncbi:LuxR family two component transcriptional regulator [Pontibacter ummariensis]|uniref:Two component transcriptional regulator, LuxR family n=1 Tax=Pontibacter ummariensis TaxID=1610492 RepID=A0A239KYU8_9BACT|nr:response regulator transcription factor [Pontibacter ummariensis]PRY04679.1 LuxR family two component transcriptional regulator [Pontibacter ummariensis]SNT22922.1 two component transcriptional regulator, LuxR family [Pontibacter ummariensis]
MIKLVLTDDHTLIRQGIKSLLQGSDDISIVGEAASGDELIKLLDEAQTEVDIVLMDINMPGKDGFETTRHIREHYPDVKVVALSMLDSEPHVQKMLASGADGYVLKNSGKEELRSAIRLVMQGTPYICSNLAMNMLHKATASAGPTGQQEEANENQVVLSKREMEVLGLIAEGFTNAEIADKLFTSKRTIETHRQNILEKTKAKNTASLIKMAVKTGLIE